MATLYVNPAIGTDRGNGSQSSPFKTITQALTQARSGTTIQLEMGTYDEASGEAFPLRIPAGVNLIGSESSRGRGILIEGNGRFTSPSAASQNTTIVMAGNAQLRGVTVTNGQIRGTGVWVESASPTLANCIFTYCKREGVYATGAGSPNLLNNTFIQNEGYGLSLEGSMAGEVKGNTFQDTGYGLSIKGNVTTRITDNAIFENRAGILIAGNARPVLRRNLIERNSTDGIVITNNATPDLGSPQDPGRNTIRSNGRFDVNNGGTAAVASHGNIVSGNQVQGSVNVVPQNTLNVLNPTTMTTYVNSATGSDSGTGTQSSPFKTIARALRQVQAGTQIQVAPGSYTASTGEAFPLVIPSGVTLVGNATTKGKDIQITGSGTFTSPSAASQNVTILMQNNSTLQGVTVTNDQIRGTATWIESVYCNVANCTFIRSKREGIFITGSAIPDVFDNLFKENAGNGIALAGNAKGEIRGNKFDNTGYGIAVQAQAAPLVIENELINNRSGMVLSGSSKPVLRKNKMEKNLQDGLTVIAESFPDLGTSQDPGGNILVGNLKYDLQNASKFELISVGNQINPTKVKGSVKFGLNEIPPTPTPTPAPTPTPTPTPDSNFTDIKGHWAEGFIKGLAKLGIISGFPDKTFRPDASLTRAEFAALLNKAFSLTPIRPAMTFIDVPVNHWAAAAIEKASRAGFLSGFPDKTFRPDQNLTRAQSIVSLVNGLKFTGGTQNSLLVYSDRAQIPSFAINAVAAATEKRMVVDYPRKDVLNPQRDITRAEASAILYQTLVALNRASAIDSPYIV